MFIKYDESELFDFFEGNPAIIGEYEAGNWIYTYQNNNFKVVLLISTYELYAKISISYLENIVYSEEYHDVKQIKKIDSDTIKIESAEKSIIVKKAPQIGVMVEPN